MTHYKEIQELVEAGEKATQGKWYAELDSADDPCDVWCDPEQPSFVAKTMDVQSDKTRNAEFIAAAANARPALKALLAENKRYREALEFYADEKCYKPRSSYCPARGEVLLSDISSDEYGSRARQALNPSA